MCLPVELKLFFIMLNISDLNIGKDDRDYDFCHNLSAQRVFLLYFFYFYCTRRFFSNVNRKCNLQTEHCVFRMLLHRTGTVIRQGDERTGSLHPQKTTRISPGLDSRDERNGFARICDHRAALDSRREEPLYLSLFGWLRGAGARRAQILSPCFLLL